MKAKAKNGVSKRTSTQLKDELRNRGLRVNEYKSYPKAQMVMYLKNQEALNDYKVVIDNAIAELLTINAATDTTAINDGTIDTTVVNSDATGPSHSINSNVVNGSTDDTTGVNGSATGS